MANLWKDQIFNAACSALVVTLIFGLAMGSRVISKSSISSSFFFVMPVVDNGPITASLCLNVMEGC